MEKILHWSPRILSIAFILFLSLFALDVFDVEAPLWEMIAGFLIHLIPNFILALFLFIAWKHEKIGGIIFIILSIIFTICFKTYEIPSSFLMISFPAFLIGFLFLFNGIRKKKIN